MAEYDNQIPLKLQLLRIGLGAGPDALGIFTYQIEGHNTNYAAPYFCIAPANYRPDTMDILDSMQETKDAILCYAAPDDLREIMGLTPQGELDQDILESDDSEYVSLDGGWYLDGQLLSFEKIPPAASDAHAILPKEQNDFFFYYGLGYGLEAQMQEAELPKEHFDLEKAIVDCRLDYVRQGKVYQNGAW